MTVRAPERRPPAPPEAAPAAAAEIIPAPPVSVLRCAVSAFGSTAAAGWMAAGLFTGAAPRVVGVGGAALGAAIIALSYRARRPSLVQYLALPAGALLGALLVLPDARGGADLASLVSESLRGGGLAQPPLPFDPGWRFVLAMLVVVLAAASSAVAIALARPKLAVALPVPVILGGALLAPPGGETASGAVAIALLLGALAVSYGAEVSGGATGETRRFERKRLVRGVVLLVMLAAAMAGLGRARFLFPSTTKQRVVPAQRPVAQAVLPDRVLFTVGSRDPGPWRLGVLDGYDGRAWLLPSYDPARLRDVAGDGSLAEGLVKLRIDRPTAETTFTIAAAEGHVLPVASHALSVHGLRGAQVDPLTQSLRLSETRARRGLRYTVTSAAAPSGAELSAAPAPPAWTARFTSAPEPPNEVVTLLARAPRTPWDRLQSARAALYRTVIAAGAGHPAEVPPERVAALLRGAEATPYEITAAETLIARWAGIPARIGYGFYAGDRPAGSLTASVRPRHGATWLEAYFEGYGWVPVVGVPPRARSSLSEEQKNLNPNVRPSEELALVVHVPIRLQSIRLLYVTVRYWLGVGLGAVALAALAWWSFPGVLKIARRVRRSRWGRAGGPRARIAAAYAEFRDRAADLGVGAAAASPLRFRAVLASDEEHTELAWLVTRALWGDLARDLRDSDAAAAEELARSLAQRLSRAQTGLVRVLAFGARTSLREPYSSEVPNLWPAWLGRGRDRATRSGRWSRRRAMRAARRALAGTLVALLAASASCGRARGEEPRAHDLPPRLVPERIGDISFRREPAAERAYLAAGDASLVAPGRVWTVRQGTTIQASIQAAAFKAGFDALDHDVREGILSSVGGGRFRLERLGAERVWTRDLPEQRLLLWFTPDGGSMILMDARRAFTAADRTFLELLRFIRGAPPAPAGPPPLPYDPRRGAQA